MTTLLLRRGVVWSVVVLLVVALVATLVLEAVV